jgi:hypothetical protein
VERAAWLSLHVAQLDAKAIKAGTMTEHDSRTYLAYSASLVRTLKALGLKGAAEAPASLADLLAAIPRATPASVAPGDDDGTDDADEAAEPLAGIVAGGTP